MNAVVQPDPRWCLALESEFGPVECLHSISSCPRCLLVCFRSRGLCRMRLQVEEQVGWPRKESHAARPLSCEAWPLP